MWLCPHQPAQRPGYHGLPARLTGTHSVHSVCSRICSAAESPGGSFSGLEAWPAGRSGLRQRPWEPCQSLRLPSLEGLSSTVPTLSSCPHLLQLQTLFPKPCETAGPPRCPELTDPPRLPLHCHRAQSSATCSPRSGNMSSCMLSSVELFTEDSNPPGSEQSPLPCAPSQHSYHQARTASGAEHLCSYSLSSQVTSALSFLFASWLVYLLTCTFLINV